MSVDILQYIWSNKEWVFSGIGIAILSALWFLVRFLIRRRQQVSKIAQRDRYPDTSNKRNQYLDLIYDSYQCSDSKATVYTCTSTWPIDELRSETLINLKASSISFLGPIRPGKRFLGVLWRLGISQSRSDNLCRFKFFHREKPGVKFAVIGDDVVVSDSRDESPSTTGKRWRDFPTFAAILRDFFGELRQEATSLADHLRKLMADHLQATHTKKVSVSEMLSFLTNSAVEKSFSFNDQLAIFVSYLKTLLPSNRLILVKNPRGDLDIVYCRSKSVKQQVLPALRIVLTPHCKFHCSYCPRYNENFHDADPALSGEEFSRFVQIACQIGFRHFRFTGGEPLEEYPVFEKCVEENMLSEAPYSIYVSTNASRLGEYLEKLSRIKNLTVKVSLDTLDSEHFAQIVRTDRSNLDDIRSALEASKEKIKVGINTVVTQINKNDIELLTEFCRASGFYLKLMDLNWYADLPNGYWEKNFVDLRGLRADLAKRFSSKKEVKTIGDFGIPMTQFVVSEGSFVRIKDSNRGSTYSPYCEDPKCPYFPCQEGIYQLSFTSDGKLKVCRHRPDLAIHIAESLRAKDDKAVEEAIRTQINRFFVAAHFHDHRGKFFHP